MNSYLFPLFQHMSADHGLTLTDDELHQIINAVDKCRPVEPVFGIEVINEGATLKIHDPATDAELYIQFDSGTQRTLNELLRILEPYNLHGINPAFTCAHCKAQSVRRNAGYEPYKDEHWSCALCNSTYAITEYPIIGERHESTRIRERN